MWISKAEYEYLEEENKRLREEARGLDDLLARARMMSIEGKPEILIADRCCLLLKDAYDDLVSRIVAAESDVRTLTAERDWYKNAFAEQRCLAALAEKGTEGDTHASEV